VYFYVLLWILIESRPHIVILYYDYVLTVQIEIERYWNPQCLTWASALFFVNRYGALLGHIPVIYEALSGTAVRGQVRLRFRIIYYPLHLRNGAFAKPLIPPLGEMAPEQKLIAVLIKYDSILVLLLQVFTAGERLLMIVLPIQQANLQSIGALPHSTAYIEGLCTLRS